MSNEITEKIYKELVLEGEIIYVSGIEPVRRRDGEIVVSKKSGEPLDKKFIILRTVDKFEYKIETVATKVSKGLWMSFFSSYPMGTQMRIKVSLVGAVKTKESGEKDIYYSFQPEMTEKSEGGKTTRIPAEILWVPDKSDLNPENSDLPF